MIRYYTVLFFLIFHCQLWSQADTINIKNYLIGDWYFIDENNDVDCHFDSSYNEIVFYDSSYVFMNSCSFIQYDVSYQLRGNKITINISPDDSIQAEGKLSILDNYTFNIDFKESNLVFYRITSEEYKLSEQIHDNISVNKLSLKMPHEVSSTLWNTGFEYYMNCMKRREMWVRLERKEIDKKSVIKWVDDIIEQSDYGFEIRKCEVFKGMVDNIFD